MAIAGILMAAGYGMQAFGTYQAGKKQAQALRYEAAIARRNAAAAQEQAKADADQQQLQAMKIMAEGEAGYAAAGLSGGSVDAVMRESAVNAEFDRLNILFGGDVRSAGFMSEAEQKLSAAKDIKEAGILGALSYGFKAGAAATDGASVGSDSGYSPNRSKLTPNGKYAGGQATRYSNNFGWNRGEF